MNAPQTYPLRIHFGIVERPVDMYVNLWTPNDIDQDIMGIRNRYQTTEKSREPACCAIRTALTLAAPLISIIACTKYISLCGLFASNKLCVPYCSRILPRKTLHRRHPPGQPSQPRAFHSCYLIYLPVPNGLYVSTPPFRWGVRSDSLT